MSSACHDDLLWIGVCVVLYPCKVQKFLADSGHVRYKNNTINNIPFFCQKIKIKVTDSFKRTWHIGYLVKVIVRYPSY